MKNHKLLLTLSILPLILVVSACNKKEEPTQAKIVMSLPGSASETIFMPYSFNLSDYVVADGKYNNDIARMSILFDATTSRHAHVEFKKSKYQPDGDLDADSFYKHFDLVDHEKKSTTLIEHDYDKQDGTVYDIAHKEVTIEKNSYEICFVTIEDSGTSGANWASNFDLGADLDSYYTATGEHPEWTDKNNHKGFDIAANRCFDMVNSYKTSKLNKNSQQIFYIFGHSRGGAIANLLASKMIDNGLSAVAYCLASPATTTKESAKDAKYNNIHNIVCKDDVVTNMLLEKWNFKRYGNDVDFKITDCKDSFKNIFGTDLPNGDNSLVPEVFASLADTREDIYTVSDKFTVLTSEPLDEDGVTSLISRYSMYFVDGYEVLGYFVEFEKVPAEDNLTIVKVKTCPAFLTSFIGAIMSQYGLNLISVARDYLKFATYLNSILSVSKKTRDDLLSINTIYILYCHYYQSYTSYLWAE